MCASLEGEPESDTHPSAERRCRNLDKCYVEALAEQRASNPVTAAVVPTPGKASLPKKTLANKPPAAKALAAKPATPSTPAKPPVVASASEQKTGAPNRRSLERIQSISVGCRPNEELAAAARAAERWTILSARDCGRSTKTSSAGLRFHRHLLAKLPYSKLRDAVIAHLTMAEGLGPPLGNVRSMMCDAMSRTLTSNARLSHCRQKAPHARLRRHQ